jgi:GR25 family glycosyltransferase involved in LPS biosynthesis
MGLKNQPYKVWCLSLKSNKDRREWMLSIKNRIGLDFEFWDATTPDDITNDIKEKYFKYVNFYEWDVIVEAVMATFISHMNILKWSVDNKTNVILIEDDLDYINDFDWDDIEWETFDIFKLGEIGMNCYSYAVNWKGAERLLQHFNSIQITEAYDVELHKIQHLKFKYLPKPSFIQVQNKFISNLAPNGYKRIKTHNKNKRLL